jgi:Flp pilus assembly protein TadD
VLIFYMSSRYRLAAVPPLVVFAAHTIDRLVADFDTRRRRALVTAAAVVAIFAVAHPEWDSTGLHQDAAAHCNMGLAWIGQRSQPAPAAREFRRAVEIDPSLVECWYDLGIALLSLGQAAPAAEAFAAATARMPTWFEAQIGRGRALEEAGDLAGARAAYSAALRLRPGDPAVASALARVESRGGS